MLTAFEGLSVFSFNDNFNLFSQLNHKLILSRHIHGKKR